jgi:hypothetical protein
MIEVYWNYSDIKELSEECNDAIFITDSEDEGMSIGINDIDTIIDGLNRMKVEWEQRHYLKELPKKFQFVVGSNSKIYQAKLLDGNVIVMWIEDDMTPDGYIYNEKDVLERINRKSWTIL